MRLPHRSSDIAIAFASLLVFAIVLSMGLSVWWSRQQLVEEWRQQLSNISLMLAAQTSQQVTSAYLALDSVADSVHASGIVTAADLRGRLGGAEVAQGLRDKSQGMPQVTALMIVAANGDIVNQSGGRRGGANLARRDFFQAHLRDAGLGTFVSAPVQQGGEGRWTFHLSRRLNGPDGQFLGLVVIGFSSNYLSDFYAKNSLGEGASVSLFRRDFTLLARWPHQDALVGKTNRTGASYRIIEQMKRSEGVVLISGAQMADGNMSEPRLGASRKIPHYPLIINVTATEDVFLAQWYRYATMLTLVAGLSILVVVFGSVVLARTLRKRERDMGATERLKAEADAANLAKSEFLAMMSHEIRTPLTSIIGFAEMLGSAQEVEIRRDVGQVILRNGHHLLALINDILDISKIEAGRLGLESVAFSPYETATAVDSMMHAQALSKGIAFHVAIDYPFPSQVMGDPTRWKQILFNLCSNAIKFTELGTVRLRLRYDDAGSHLVCQVSDTGIGISAAQRKLLFAPFSQADNSIARKYGGTGLGLHLVLQLATRMGGTVDVSSELGKGSVFEVEIPAAPAPGAGMLARSPMAAARAAMASGLPSARLRGSVLLAEDGPDNRMLICAFLARLGLEVQVATNGVQAVALALGGDFDLILMDIQMPVMDGMRATEMLRLAGQKLPIVALTANVMAEDERRYLAAGCSHCVGKPIDFNALTQLLAALLSIELAPPAPERDSFAPIRRAFESQLPLRLAECGAALRAADWPELARLAHMLRGSAGSFGYHGVTALAGEVEGALARGDHRRAAEAMRRLCELDEVCRLRPQGGPAPTPNPTPI
ncbi:hybrid sensor histidine kinase/response regulator [Massilia glaciei]|uniref:Virulence sensor protein BvgS n=1 Tax=Massilia glaciei TaxID=1524097 RepID=A0A2U2HIW7_9BURK|nr:hybrid sensor histidine kinase/response regulator [Massilia glaciei]PWF46776.1 hypothetical protein C7C56_015375 [Massilia glaciei]